MTSAHEPELPGGLSAILGASLGCTSVVMAPVPFLGTAMALVGIILSWLGRRSDFRGAAKFGVWSNAVALVIGLTVTTWFVWKHW
jgi:hypothetical protein